MIYNITIKVSLNTDSEKQAIDIGEKITKEIEYPCDESLMYGDIIGVEVLKIEEV
jgi:hypothetical protein